MNTFNSTSSYDKMTKKELLEICESLQLTSYKSKNKSELIVMIQNKYKQNICNIEEVEDNLDSDEEISEKINFKDNDETNIEQMEKIKSKYGEFFMFFNLSTEGKEFWKNNPIKITTKQ